MTASTAFSNWSYDDLAYELRTHGLWVEVDVFYTYGSDLPIREAHMLLYRYGVMQHFDPDEEPHHILARRGAPLPANILLVVKHVSMQAATEQAAFWGHTAWAWGGFFFRGDIAFLQDVRAVLESAPR